MNIFYLVIIRKWQEKKDKNDRIVILNTAYWELTFAKMNRPYRKTGFGEKTKSSVYISKAEMIVRFKCMHCFLKSCVMVFSVFTAISIFYFCSTNWLTYFFLFSLLLSRFSIQIYLLMQVFRIMRNYNHFNTINV